MLNILWHMELRLTTSRQLRTARMRNGRPYILLLPWSLNRKDSPILPLSSGKLQKLKFVTRRVTASLHPTLRRTASLKESRIIHGSAPTAGIYMKESAHRINALHVIILRHILNCSPRPTESGQEFESKWIPQSVYFRFSQEGT